MDFRNKKGKGNILLILFLLLVLLSALVGIVILSDYVGIIDAQEKFYPILSKVGLAEKPEPVTGNLLEKEILKNKETALKNKEKELIELQTNLKQKQEELNELELKLEQKEQDLMLKEKAFLQKQKDAETEQEKINRQAFYFSNMKPQESAQKLANMPDELVIKILKSMEDQKTVAVILMSMEDQKAAELLRKMSR